ncbi:hypothetical protein JNJ66_00985 [Candidatus Saccharibacteria bacterium]|nr:hypothetical protein [Candidatus Saccharibacteria bacterium]
MSSLPGYHFHSTKRTAVPGALVAAVIGLTGIVLLGGVFAAGRVVAFEAEDAEGVATGTAGAHALQDAAASNSKALRFGLAPVTDDGGDDAGGGDDPTDPTDPGDDGGVITDPGDDGTTAECAAPAGAAMQDTEGDTYYWEITGDRLDMVLSIKDLPEPWAGHIKKYAEVWSAGPCVKIKVIAEACGDTQPCLPVVIDNANPGIGGVDRDTEGRVFKRAQIALNETAHAAAADADGERKITAGHAIGRALGLGLRTTPEILMSSVRPLVGGSTAPDSVDFENLKVLYGSQVSGMAGGSSN